MIGFVDSRKSETRQFNDEFDVISVEYVPDLNGQVVFSESSSQVFREDEDIVPLRIGEDICIMPWGADNLMPYDVMDLVDDDETVATCMNFNSEVAFGAGMRYEFIKDKESDPSFNSQRTEIAKFLRCNRINKIFFGHCTDLKMFDFCVSYIFLNEKRDRIIRIVRKHAAYCRFAKADDSGKIPYVVYAFWKNPVNAEDCEVVPLLDEDDLICDLENKIKSDHKQSVYAVVSKVPKVSSTYYPIPAYASIFKSDWFDIKKIIGKAKKAKLNNSAPIKYHIEVSNGYWSRACDKEGLTDPVKRKDFVKILKKQMIDFITGADNAGKVLFSQTFVSPDGQERPEVKVNKISSDEKEGGDFTTDIQEAVNMICFAMRVHSNLVGSVPGKSQSNNSGSDKRELYTIAETLQKPYHNIMLEVHELVCQFNGWDSVVTPKIDIIQLQTLDKHTDAKTV